MRFALCCLVILTMIGCYRSQPPIIVNPPPSQQEAAPPVPNTQPVPPATPSKSYLTGYNDGYFGTWLAPGRWLVGVEYRSGWSAGAYDREHNLPHRYQPAKK